MSNATWCPADADPEPTPCCDVCGTPYTFVLGGYSSGPSHYEQDRCECRPDARVAIVDVDTGTIECVCTAAEFARDNEDIDRADLAAVFGQGWAEFGDGAAPRIRVELFGDFRRLAKYRASKTVVSSLLMAGKMRERADALLDAMLVSLGVRRCGEMAVCGTEEEAA